MAALPAAEHYGRRNVGRASLRFILGKGLGGGVGLCWLLLLVRALPAGDYGVYVGFVAYLELFNQLSNLGLAPLSERYVPAYRASGDEPALRRLIGGLVAGRAASVALLGGASALALPWLAPLFGVGAAAPAFLVFHLVLAAETLLRFVETIFDSLLLQGRSQVSLLARTAARLLLLLAALRAGNGISIEQLVWIEVAAFGVGLVVTGALLWRTLRRLHGGGGGPGPGWLAMWRFAAPIYASQLVGSLIGLDMVKLLVLRGAGAPAAALFGFCASLAWMLQRYLPSFLLVGMVRPLIVAAATTPGGESRLRRIVASLLLLNALLIGYGLALSLAISDPLLQLLSGGKFDRAGPYLAFFLLYTMSQTLRTIFGHLALARHQGRAMLSGQIGSAALLACAAWLAAPGGAPVYCAALLMMDVNWLFWVRRGLAARGAAPRLPLRALAWLGAAALFSGALGAAAVALLPAAWGPRQVVSAVAALAGLAYIFSCVFVMSLKKVDLNGIMLPVPQRLRRIAFNFHQLSSSIPMLPLQAVRKFCVWAETRYRVNAIKRLAARPTPPAKAKAPHLVLLPSDPEQVFGSRGDQAMLFSVMSEFRSLHPAGKISIITTPHSTGVAGKVPGVTALPIWGQHGVAADGLAALEEASVFAVIGADIMDGYYWPMTVLRIAMICEEARLRGAQVGVLGFSFNAAPNPACVEALAALHSEIRLHSRDPVSAQRFAELVGRRPTLVADVAFCLVPRPTPAVAEVAAWAAAQHAEGRAVVGFNLHLMLLDVPGACDEATAVAVAAQGLVKLVEQCQASVLLMPHDFRGSRNDKTMLAKCLPHIPPQLRARVLMPETEFMADELKALAAHCDLVMTGRMHLAIATLGRGVPIAAASYQDKFEGCLEHFGLPEAMIIQPYQLGDPDAVWAWMKLAYDSRAALARQIEQRWPAVKQLSKKNFSWMGGALQPAAAAAPQVS